MADESREQREADERRAGEDEEADRRVEDEDDEQNQYGGGDGEIDAVEQTERVEDDEE